MQRLNMGPPAFSLPEDSGIAESPLTRTVEVDHRGAQYLGASSPEDTSLHSMVPARKLRLLLVITRLTAGGDTNVLLDIARHFTNHPIIEAEIAAGPVPENEIDLTPIAHENQIPTSIIPTLSNRPDPRHMIRAVMDLRRLMRRRQYDIVHTHSSAAGIVGRIAARTVRVPIIVHHVHGWGLQEGMSPPMRCAYLRLERLCARFTDRLIAVSRATVQKGLACCIASQNKFALIYNGINLSEFCQEVDTLKLRLDLGLDRDCKLVGMIGRLDRQKNPLDFIRAAALVVRRCPQARFLIVGDGALRGECERLINEFNLQQRCILLGFRNDVAQILPLLEVVASTSLWEGLPVAFQEAMCAGRPIVANDVDGVSEVVRNGETGYLVAPHSPQVTADRILRLLFDDELRIRLGARARLDSKRFSTAQMLQDIELLYTQLMAPKYREALHLARPCMTTATTHPAQN